MTLLGETEKPPLEREIVASIRKHLNNRPGVWHLKHYGGGFAKQGVPDLFICYYGLFVAFEVKRPSTKPTQVQRTVIGEIAARGHGFVAVVRSLEEAVAYLDRVHAYIKARSLFGSVSPVMSLSSGSRAASLQHAIRIPNEDGSLD